MDVRVGRPRLPLGKSTAIASGWRGLVVVVAVITLTVSLANRTFHGSFYSQPTIQSAPHNAKIQHRDKIAVEWVAPPAILERLRMIEPSIAGRVEERVLADFHCESLYNRPPPLP